MMGAAVDRSASFDPLLELGTAATTITIAPVKWCCSSMPPLFCC